MLTVQAHKPAAANETRRIASGLNSGSRKYSSTAFNDDSKWKKKL